LIFCSLRQSFQDVDTCPRSFNWLRFSECGPTSSQTSAASDIPGRLRCERCRLRERLLLHGRHPLCRQRSTAVSRPPSPRLDDASSRLQLVHQSSRFRSFHDTRSHAEHHTANVDIFDLVTSLYRELNATTVYATYVSSGTSESDSKINRTRAFADAVQGGVGWRIPGGGHRVVVIHCNRSGTG
jgi:hypothetical protein